MEIFKDLEFKKYILEKFSNYVFLDTETTGLNLNNNN